MSDYPDLAPEYAKFQQGTRVILNRPARDMSRAFLVRLISDGSLVSLDRPQDFDPRFHKRLTAEEVKPKVAAPEESASVLAATTPEEALTAPAERFAQLKAKGFVYLAKAEKAEYKALKEILGA